MESLVEKRYEGTLLSKGLRYGIIEVTSYCQCLCPGCYMVASNSLNKGNMTLKQAVRVLDLCRDYLGQELETMDILGGDPLLWPFLQDYIEILLKRGISPWVFTNMLAITPEKAKWLKERGVYITGKLNVNPDSHSALPLQAKMLGKSLRLAKKMFSAIEIFRTVGYEAPLFRLQNLIRRENINLASGYYRWCLKNNIGTDLELMGSGEKIGPDYWQLAPSPQEIAAMIGEIQKVRQEFNLEPAEVLMPHVFGSCPFFDKGLYFALNGLIRACSNSSVSLAHINDLEPIKKAYESELICNRISLTKELIGQPCNSCSKWEKCRGGCRATAEGTGNYKNGYPLCPVPYLS